MNSLVLLCFSIFAGGLGGLAAGILIKRKTERETSGMSIIRFCAVIGILLGVTAAILINYGLELRKGSDGDEESREIVERGHILDRNGKILAIQARRYDIWIVIPKDRNAEQRRNKIIKIAEELSPILQMDTGEIVTRINSRRNDFVLKSNATREIYDKIESARDSGKGILTSVIARPVPFRVYPEKNLAAQIIGFTGDQYKGKEGIEFAFDSELSGEHNGGKGSNVILTIDANVQSILEKVAVSTLHETQAESVMFLAMDPRNGEILGSAVVPGYDPNEFASASIERYQNLTAIPPYEPGSVFKAFSIAALLDTGAITENTEFICNGVYKRVFNTGIEVTIECVDGTAHGRVRAREIITLSCNVGAAQASDRADNNVFYKALLNMGFGSKTGAWVNLEATGLLMEPDTWSGRTKQSMAFGQEISVSALQVMQAASIIANNGVLIPPKIVSRLTSHDGKTVTNWVNPTGPRRQVIRPETARKILSYMADAATDRGTGWRANVDALLAVKTGTSQYRDPRSPRFSNYSKTDFIASCVAILPKESPSLVLYVVIVKPRGETYGGRIAAPAIRAAADELIDFLGIPRSGNQLVVHPGEIDISEERLPYIGATIPNFYGFSKKALLPLMLRSDIGVEINGEGWVRRQSPRPGTAITPGMVLLLELE